VWDKTPSVYDVVTHELGHNFGRSHAPCGNPSAPDPSYPYANASIGVYGIDLGDMTLKSPSVYADVMSYCSPDWISDYTYTGVLAFRGTSPDVVPSGSAGGARPGLLVWGRIRANGQLVLEPAFRVTAPPLLPPAGERRYQISGLNDAGGRVFSLAFDGQEVADLPGGPERHFAFVVPLADADFSAIRSLQLKAEGKTALRGAVGATQPLAPSRPLAARRAGPDRVEVSWDPSYPMALVRDAVTGQVLSFARGGRSQVHMAGPAVTVELSDGVRSRAPVVVRAR
jgi:hypothetical protein